MVVFTVDSDERGQPASRVQPKSFSTPRKVRNAKALQIDSCVSDDEFIRPAVLDRQLPRSKSLKHLGSARYLPLANEHHLERRGCVRGDGKELRRPRGSAQFI